MRRSFSALRAPATVLLSLAMLLGQVPGVASVPQAQAALPAQRVFTSAWEIRAFIQTIPGITHIQGPYPDHLSGAPHYDAPTAYAVCKFAGYSAFQANAVGVGRYHSCGDNTMGWWTGPIVAGGNFQIRSACDDNNYISSLICINPIQPAAPATVNNATCSVLSAPASVAPGAQYPVTFRLKNNGTRPWAKTTHRLNAAAGTAPATIALPSNVAAGATIDVTAVFTAPSAGGVQTLSYRMGQGTAAFGATCSAQVQVQALPQCSDQADNDGDGAIDYAGISLSGASANALSVRDFLAATGARTVALPPNVTQGIGADFSAGDLHFRLTDGTNGRFMTTADGMLALSGAENFTLTFPGNTHTFAFGMMEPSTTPGTGFNANNTPATFLDSVFTLTFLQNGVTVGTMTVNSDNDALRYHRFVSQAPFNSVVFSENGTSGINPGNGLGIDNEFFGPFYVGTRQAAAIPADPGCASPDDNDESNGSSSSSALPQCRDGQDNDGDNRVDSLDPGCHSDGNPYNPGSYVPDDNDEGNPGTVQCNDGVDNADAEDQLADMADPGCHSDGNPNNANSYIPLDTDEGNAASSSSASSAPSTPQCRDGQDNDGDARVDSLDPGCHSDGNPYNPGSYVPDDNDEGNPGTVQCNDGIDNADTEDSLADMNDPGCHFDGNANNPNSYVPLDTDEGNAASSSSASSALPQCRDGQDNDNDGAIDYPSDFSCSGPDDNDETNPRAQCQDGFDNDGDGKVDSVDPGCHYDGNPGNPNSYNPQDNDEFNATSSSSASSQAPQCRDNVDNDNDGAVDYPSDFSCSHPDDNDETLPRAACQDNQDNDGDGRTDAQDAGCHYDGNPGNPNSYNPQDNDEFNAGSSASSALPQCRDGSDNDNDGATDYPSDFSCSGPDDNDETNPRAACQDGVDNDYDGRTDGADAGCHTDGNPNNPNSYNPQDNDEFNASSAPSLGCILVLNETFDVQGNPIYQAAAQFTYTLDGNQTAVNNASGIARFDGVSPGNHLISQQGNGAWTNLSITPAGGNVQVAGGPICAAVIFKNKQNSVSGQSSSVYNPYPYYQPDPYAYGSGKEQKMCRGLSDKYGDRYASSKKNKKLPKAIRKLMDDCDDAYGNESWWKN